MMASLTQRQIHSDLEQWLRRVGFSRGNPFEIGEAESEPFVPECFVDPGVYDSIKDDPQTLLVFAPRGGGKTALRVMLASDCRPLQPIAVNPHSSDLAVTYTDFDPALAACDYELTRLTPAHHVAGILRSACSALLDAFWQDAGLAAALSPPDRTLFASYCRHFNPALLGADTAYRRMKSICPEIEVPWSDLRQAITERRLAAFLQGCEMPLAPQLQWYAELVDDIPEPLASADSPVTLLSGFAQLVQRIGLKRLYILVDRLDERFLTFQEPNNLVELVAPLISNLPLMGVPGIAFRLFLPREARESVLPFVRRDRRLKVLEVTWNDNQLRQLLRLRLRVYSEDKVQALGKLCETSLAPRIEDEMIEAANGSPRRLLQLGAALLETQVTLSPNKRAITDAAWGQTLDNILGEHVVRPLRVSRQEAQAYLGRVTPVKLSPIPYRLILCLYDTKGFCTNREISKAVWGDEEWASDELIRQTVKRVRDALKEAGANPDYYLVNEPGRGYKLQNTA
ncbi:MAG: hypothetical protein Kow0063_18790 [Anaerolineae bacterium]